MDQNNIEIMVGAAYQTTRGMNELTNPTLITKGMEPVGETSRPKHVLIVINPISGTGSANLVKKKLEKHFQRLGWHLTMYKTTGSEDLRLVVRNYLLEPFDLVVAAGGDGTLSQVASGMAHSETPLGVIPTGTWNAFARNMGIPMIHDLAIRLLTGRHSIRKLDALEVNGTLYLLNVSIGISSNMVKLTDRKSKQRLGALAYFKNLFLQFFGLSQHNYNLTIDGKNIKVRASELMITNGGMVGLGELPTRLNIQPDDGLAEACIMNPLSIFELAAVAWNVLFWRTRKPAPIRCLPISSSITIRATRPVTIQGDGEIIGTTPVNIRLVPGAISMIVPQDDLKQIIQLLLQPDGILKFKANINLNELAQAIPALKHIHQILLDPRNREGKD